jgi:hypothetical protein
MHVDADDEDTAVMELIAQGDAHFAEVGHPMDQSMTPEMKEQMTREHMQIT